MARKFMSIAWPAFIAACLLELVVFALVDPLELHWGGHILEVSRMTAYTGAFFVFWAATALASALTCLLATTTSDVRHGVR